MQKGVLFLDIDGVICTDRAYYASSQDKERNILRTWDSVGIALVDRLCQDYNLEVVVSSTWRHRYDVPLILLTHGFRSDFHKDDKTPVCRIHSTRGMEIRDWLEEHPEVTRFIIIDDDAAGIRNTELEKKWVETDSNDGILTHHYLKAKKILETT